jgi:hypothetical protein
MCPELRAIRRERRKQPLGAAVAELSTRRRRDLRFALECCEPRQANPRHPGA